jgi:hypothetical protein
MSGRWLRRSVSYFCICNQSVSTYCAVYVLFLQLDTMFKWPDLTRQGKLNSTVEFSINKHVNNIIDFDATADFDNVDKSPILPNRSPSAPTASCNAVTASAWTRSSTAMARQTARTGRTRTRARSPRTPTGRPIATGRNAREGNSTNLSPQN